MPSQEDYLDGLLKGLSKELEELEIEQKELAAMSEGELGIEGDVTSDLSALMPEPTESEDTMISEEAESLDSLGGFEEAESPEIPKEPELSLSQEESELLESLGGLEEAESSEISEEPELSLSQEESELLESLGGLEEAESSEVPEEPEILVPQEESVLLDALDELGETDSTEDVEASEYKEELQVSDLAEGIEDSESSDISVPAEDSDNSEDADFVGLSEVSSMSEEEIEKLLAAGRVTDEDSKEDVSEDFGVDMLADSNDSELQEIQDLLEKSDNNEAVGDEIEALLSADQEEGIPIELFDPDGTTDETGEQLSSKQQKALMKKRLKEEAAAAKKAKKEAKKAAKAAKKGKKAEDQNEKAASAEAAEGEMTEEPADMSLLDSILSEADKISGGDTAAGLTGNFDAKIEGNLQEQNLQEQMGEKAEEAAVENAEDIGLDLDSLFGDSDGAEEPVAVDGNESEFPDFVALDGEDVAGIAELTGEGGEGDRPKKKGFLARLIDFLMQEDEDEEEEEKKSENEDIQLSEENQEILNDLDKEKGKQDKKGKKGKKKAKKAEASKEEDEEVGEEEGKSNKKKKEKKPKKEKPPKEEEKVDPRKQLTLKKMMPIILFCLSLGLAIIILTNLSVDFTDKKIAREAYYNGDYQTCYQNFYGKELNESDQVMFGKSESVLVIRLWIREYEMFIDEMAYLEALDRLIQAVDDYPDLYQYASQWNASGDVAVEYAVILNLLYENYGLTEEQARAIAAEPNDIEYTKQVNAIVQGGVYGSWNKPEPVPDAPLTEVLPEEAELPEGNFIETNKSAQ